jgi:SAM-dependent methyltransferase
MKSEEVLQINQAQIEGLPEPHKCPWLVQYLLASRLRRLLDPLELARLVGEKGKVISVDIEPRAVKRLEKRALKAGLAGRMEIRSCEARDLGLAGYEGQVDLITVIHTLHELDDLQGFFTQAAALLKPSGRLLVVEPRGHLRSSNFQAELECGKLAGFGVLETPDMGGRRMAALLAPPLARRTI